MNGAKIDVSLAKKQTEEEKKESEECLKHFEAKKVDRSYWENTWDLCFQNIIPRKGTATNKDSPGEKRGHDLFDTTAIMSNQLLAGALQSMLTNPTTIFFDLFMEEDELNEREDVKQWLQDTASRMFRVLSNSNFQTEIHEIYTDLGAIGTACLFMGEHPESVVHFSARHMKEIYIEENSEGLVDSVDRCFSWTPRQIIQEFKAENCPEVVLKSYNEGSFDPMEIVHKTYPMEESEYQSKGKMFKFGSKYLLKEPAFLLREDHFPELPYCVPRWTKTSGEKYGRGPGMDMLPDILMVNKMMEITLSGAEKTIDPPLQVDDDGVIGRVRLTPGGLTVTRPSSQNPIRPIITNARVDFGMQVVEDTRRRIRAGFYVDQLQLKEGDRMTTVEVNQRTEEQARMMGPVLGRQHFETLRPLIDRVFGIMYRRKLLKEPPQAIRGRKVLPRYSSLLARVQRSNEGQSLMRAIQIMAPLVTALPETLDNIDGDKAFHFVMDMEGVPNKIMRDEQSKKELRDARSEANAKLAQEQSQQHQADIASKVGPAAAQLMTAQQQQRGA